MYEIGDKIKIKRCGPTKLEINVSGSKAQVFTEDLGYIVREELPKDRAKDLFSEVEERAFKRGKARVVVQAQKDIRRGEEVCFTIDINKYVGDSQGVRTTPAGLIF